MEIEALVVGATGIAGRGVSYELLVAGARVHGLSRHRDGVVAGVEHVGADLLDSASLHKAVSGIKPSHVYLTAWSRRPTEQENIKVNAGMVRAVLEAVAPARSVKHVALVTGLKHYLGPFEAYVRGGVAPPTPLREEQPRLDLPNFYYNQEDELYSAAKRDGFTWSVHRPHTIIGKAIGNAMNMGSTLAAYASICKEVGRPFKFPGSAAQWNGLSDMTDARVLGKQLVWASTTDVAKNEAYNIVNGDIFRWSWLWPRIAKWFGVAWEGFEAIPVPLEGQMAKDGEVWKAMAAKHGLVEPDLWRVASPWHTDLDMGRPLEVMTDMARSRKLGFLVYQSTEDAFNDLFATLRVGKFIPLNYVGADDPESGAAICPAADARWIATGSAGRGSDWTSGVSTPNRRQRPGGSGDPQSRTDGDRMTENELLRIIAFLERVRLPFQELVPIAEEDTTWNLLLFLIKNHLTGTPVAISALASVAKAPHATAMRRIHALIERGDILQEPLAEGSKRFKLRPSEALLESFIQYARKIKFLLAETFGLRSKVDSDEDFYFGGSYFAAQIIPPPRLIESLFRGKQEIQFLLNDDNYFLSMRNMWADFRNNMASRKNFDLRKLPHLHQRLVENAEMAVSEYDIVAINAPWLGEAVKKRLVIPLDEHIGSAGLSSLDFHPSVWSMGSWRGQQFGVPIYCTIELLAARSDLFEKDKIEYPTTFEKTVAAAKHFHVPAKGHYGIAWNGARGMPVASTFMFLMACCGESILRIPKASLGIGVDEARGEQLRPQIESEAGLRVLDYLHRLLEFSPPDILEMDWDRRTISFLSGETALAYCWTVRAARFENDVSSAVKRKVRYLPQPRGPGGASNNPIGGFLLCIPTNLPPERVELAFEAIAWMTSPEAMKANVQNGFPVAPRFSVAADPEAAATSPIVSVVDRLAKRNLLKGWPRPPVPEYLSLEAILGEEIHKSLRRETTDKEALANAQSRADQVMQEAGYY